MNPAIYQFSSGQLFTSLTFVVICISILQLLLSIWIKSRLEKSIQHEYDKKLEEYKFLQTQRQKSEIVARFFAKWIKFRGKEQDILETKDLLNYYEDLNQMSIELSLWVVDETILKDVMKRFQNDQQSKNIRQLIGQFRELILNIKNKDFDVNEITLWPTDKIAQGLGLIDKKN